MQNIHRDIPRVRNREVPVIIDGKSVMIDLEINKLISILNDFGYKTNACCAGHHMNLGVDITGDVQRVFKYKSYRTDGYIAFQNTSRNIELIKRLHSRLIIDDENHGDRPWFICYRPNILTKRKLAMLDYFGYKRINLIKKKRPELDYIKLEINEDMRPEYNHLIIRWGYRLKDRRRALDFIIRKFEELL